MIALRSRCIDDLNVIIGHTREKGNAVKVGRSITKIWMARVEVTSEQRVGGVAEKLLKSPRYIGATMGGIDRHDFEPRIMDFDLNRGRVNRGNGRGQPSQLFFT